MKTQTLAVTAQFKVIELVKKGVHINTIVGKFARSLNSAVRSFAYRVGKNLKAKKAGLVQFYVKVRADAKHRYIYDLVESNCGRFRTSEGGLLPWLGESTLELFEKSGGRVIRL